MHDPTPDAQRRFAREVVKRLHEAGFEAYWAGGCVRDQLMDRLPQDYDVATNATPEEVRDLFGRRKTLALGMAFGVIVVLGPRGAGQIEVATFRSDAEYEDGRHPTHVTFSSACEDAQRRDFTINGLFFNPDEERVIDFVDGQADIEARIVRAIGNPADRFTEDKLRMLRAVRFAATLDFTLETATRDAIRQMAAGVTVVSAERIAEEMRKMLVSVRRTTAIRMLVDTGLAEQVLPEIASCEAGRKRFEKTLAVLDRLGEASFPLVLAALLADWVAPADVESVCRRWRLSNEITDRAMWLASHRGSLREAPSQRWSVLQKVLISPGIEELLQWTEAEAAVDGRECVEAAFCREWLARPRAELDPPPLLTGDDLLAHGLTAGPVFGQLLAQIRDAQLDGQIETKEQALDLVDRLMESGGNRI